MSFDKQFSLKSSATTSTTNTTVSDNKSGSSSSSSATRPFLLSNTLLSHTASNGTSSVSEIGGVFTTNNPKTSDRNLLDLLGQFDRKKSGGDGIDSTNDREDVSNDAEEGCSSSRAFSEKHLEEQPSVETQGDKDVKETSPSIKTDRKMEGNDVDVNSLKSQNKHETDTEIATPGTNSIPAQNTDNISVNEQITAQIQKLHIDESYPDAEQKEEAQLQESGGESTFTESVAPPTRSSEGEFLNEDSDTDEEDPETNDLGAIELNHDSQEGQTDQSSPHQPINKAFDFQRFLGLLKNKKADPIVRYIRSFLSSFSKKNWSVDEQVKLIKDFEVFMDEKFQVYEPFRTQDNDEFENSTEGLEKLIMNRLYNQCFSPAISIEKLDISHKQDVIRDEKLAIILRKFSWVEGKHLDIEQKLLNSHFLKIATTELAKINNYRSPRDKVICLLNCCKIIFGFLKQLNKETNADSFIPLLIYILLKSKIKNIVSNMVYIERFRNDRRLVGEPGYYLSSLQGAISFLENLNQTSLSVTKEEYDEHIKQFEEELKKEAKEAEDRRRIQAPKPQRAVSGSSELAEGLSNSFVPSSVLLNSAEILKSSIKELSSTFLSPSPDKSITSGASRLQVPSSRQQVLSPNLIDLDDTETSRTPIDTDNQSQMDNVYDTLHQMFPDMDESVIRDIMVIKNGNIGDCIDTLLSFAEV